MVPLLIHLPPISDDIEGNGRDNRDIVDENISKALTIYNIISGTLEKGYAFLRHGQRHFSFEIVGTEGYVHLYAVAPADKVDAIEQAITTAYPSTRLERRPEYNIFNDHGGQAGIYGGRFALKENYAYPIATYQDLKKDTFQAILNALSTIENQDGAAIQILFRPQDDGWRKKATDFAKAKRKGNDKALKVGQFAKELISAFNKAPEGKEDKPKELTAVEQSVVESIEEKTRYAGFEVSIRVIASASTANESKSIVNSIVSSFSLFNAPGKNGFKFTPSTNTNELVTNFLLRVFPHDKSKNILNVVELATLFHFPDQSGTPTSQLGRQDSKQVDAPRNMPETGLMLGYNLFRGVKKPIRLGHKDRQRHMYAVGQTGTGKSTFLENLALQDMLNGDGFAFVDPHGDTAERLLSMVPRERVEDVIYFCPSDMDYPMGMNLFEFQTVDQKDFLIQEVLNMLYKLYDPQHQGIMGPRYEDMFRNAALVIMADPNGGTFVDIPKLFRDPQFLKQKLQHVKDQTVLDFWTKQFPAQQRSNEAGEVTAWFVSKFGAFLSNEMMRNIIGQTKSAFDLRDIMDNKKILLVNLSKGRTGDLNSKLLGMMFVMKFQAAAMSRANIPEEQRIDFALYVDEFQNFSTDSFATILSEARKFRLNLIVANQFTTQLTEEIRDAIFGNIGTIVAYRVGQNDVESLARYFQPQFDGDDLLRVPNYNAIVRTMVDGVPTQPFSMAALPSVGTSNPKLSVALKQLTAAKYGRPRSVVEKEIFARLETKTPVDASGGGGMSQTSPVRSGAPASQGSFLDEWMAKQRANGQNLQVPSAPTTSQPQLQPQVAQPAAAGAAAPNPPLSTYPSSSAGDALTPKIDSTTQMVPNTMPTDVNGPSAAISNAVYPSAATMARVSADEQGSQATPGTNNQPLDNSIPSGDTVNIRDDGTLILPGQDQQNA